MDDSNFLKPDIAGLSHLSTSGSSFPTGSAQSGSIATELPLASHHLRPFFAIQSSTMNSADLIWVVMRYFRFESILLPKSVLIYQARS
jgi:hypothetical protein